MYKYEIGQTLDGFKNHPEGAQFDIADDGAIMLVFFNSPTGEEIEQFESGKGFELRFTEMYGVVMITVKIGNLSWMDAPYTPHLSPNLTGFQMPEEGHGLSLMLVLIDSATGTIKHMRILGLSEKFTKRLFEVSSDLWANPFDAVKYNSSINRIFSVYNTNQIVRLCKDYCKLNG